MRLQRSDLPQPAFCPLTRCVYNLGTTCLEPRVNKGNSDAACHKMSNRELLTHIRKLSPNEPLC